MLENFLKSLQDWSTRWKPLLDLLLTATIAFAGVLQWRVAHRLHQLTRETDARESPKLAFAWRTHTEKGYSFAIVNSGRRPTSIVDVQLQLHKFPDRPAALRASKALFDPHHMFLRGEEHAFAIGIGPSVGTVIEAGKLEFFLVLKEDMKTAFLMLGNPRSALLVVQAATGESASDEVFPLT